MRKIIITFLLLIIFPVGVNGLSDSYGDLDLIYGIDSVVVDDDYLTIDGWAYIDRETSLGGMNYLVSVVAVEKNGTNIGNYKSKNIVRSTSVEYEGDNMLFPLVCPRDSSGCKESYYHSSYEGRPKATCVSGKACIYYNPIFHVEFDMDDLKKEFAGKEITFFIEIAKKNVTISGETNSDDSTYCKYNLSVDQYTSGCRKKIKTEEPDLIRYLTFEEGVLKNKSGIIDGLSIVVNNKIYLNATSNTLVQKSDGKKLGDYKYFLNDAVYDIVGGKSLTFTNLGGLNVTKHKFRLYNVKAIYNSSSGRYIPGGTGNFYLWSAWGVLQGDVVVKFPEPAHKPSPQICNYELPKGECNVNYDVDDCKKLISYSISLAAEKNKINGEKNSGGRCGQTPYLIVQRVFSFDETVQLKMNDSSINGNMFDKKYKPSLGFNYIFQFDRVLKWKPYDTTESYGGYFYQIKYFHDSGTGCTDDLAYVSYDFLVRNNLYSYVDDRDQKIISKGIADMINDNYKFDLNYYYPDSNNKNVGVSANYINGGDANNIVNNNYDLIYDSNDTSDTYIVTQTFDMNYAHIRKKDGQKTYHSSLVSDSDGPYLDGGKKYFVPSNARKGDQLSFKTEVDDFSVLFSDKKLISQCKLEVENGPFENLKYRVINLNDPFPNYKPGQLDVDGKKRATNWETVWKKDTKFNGESATPNYGYLNDRILESDVEKYTIDLSPEHIEYIRKYNDCTVDSCNNRYSVTVDDEHFYITNNITVYGNSRFVRDNTEGFYDSGEPQKYLDFKIFKRENIKKSYLGKFDKTQEKVLD